ncbi:hypothetical protein D9611_004258 [Ephemerocybe angulata]|uniref:Enoyl reductase (ER) domain-containing protein n=1 Tax=Ephemerocybe angulata TaxID=980116 RepID=A0A8H5F5W9_9AGAR|nr:hypothetical protein D9611_004258 [Tulosesus angulatus]
MSASFAIPDTQKAWLSVRRGYPPSKSLELRNDWPVKKTLKAGEVIVKIHAAALNPVGWKNMRLYPDFIAKRPYVAEHDFSGVVVSANGSAGFKEGDEIYGWIQSAIALPTKQGALAEYLVVPAANIVKRPANISGIEAAGVSLTAMTALQALNFAKLEEGQTLFVNGGSTAVGAWAIQLAKVRGAKVVATCSKKNEEYVKKLGADEVIDYTSVGPLHTYLTQSPPSTKYNVIFEAVGQFDPSLFTYSRAYLQPNGTFVSVGPMPHEFNLSAIPGAFKWISALYLPAFLTGVRPKGKLVLVENKVEDMELLRKYLEEGKIKPTVDSVYQFHDALSAYEKLLSSRARGKVIVNVSLPPGTGSASE